MAAAALGAAAWVLAPTASADPTGNAAAVLRTGNVYVAPDLPGVRVEPAVADVLPSDVKIAVVTAAAGRPITLARQIERALGADRDHPLTVAVFTVAGPAQVTVRAVSSKYCPDVADVQAQAAASADGAQLANAEFGATIRDFAQRLRRAKLDRGDCSRATDEGGHAGAGAQWGWVLGIVALAAAAIGALVTYARHKGRSAAQESDEPIEDDPLAGVLGYGSFADGDGLDESGERRGAELVGGGGGGRDGGSEFIR
jgi:hypothetical protein